MIGTIIKKVFGDKASRDLKEVQPIAEKVKSEYPNSTAASSTTYFVLT